MVMVRDSFKEKGQPLPQPQNPNLIPNHNHILHANKLGLIETRSKGEPLLTNQRRVLSQTYPTKRNIAEGGGARTGVNSMLGGSDVSSLLQLLFIILHLPQLLKCR